MESEKSKIWSEFCRNPCEDTFRPLYESTKAVAYTISYSILRNKEDAADALQSAYCRLLALSSDTDAATSVADADSLVRRLAAREADNLRRPAESDAEAQRANQPQG